MPSPAVQLLLAEALGLALASVKRVAELLDGSVRLQSEPGKGSTFVVALPVPGPGDTGIDTQ